MIRYMYRPHIGGESAPPRCATAINPLTAKVYAMRALVTGATGFIGSHLANYLQRTGWDVVCAVRESSKVRRLTGICTTLLPVDLGSRESVSQLPDDFDLIVHACGQLGGWGIRDDTYWLSNFRSTQNLLEHFAGTALRRFIHVSTAGVLGPLAREERGAEDWPFNPVGIYETTKTEAERFARRFAAERSMPLTIIRPAFVYGPGDTHALGLFRVIQDRKFFFIGAGESLLHPTYIDDLTRGFGLCVDNEAAIGQTYLLAGRRPASDREFVALIAQELGVPAPKLRIPVWLARSVATVAEVLGKVLRVDPRLTMSRVRFFTDDRAFDISKAKQELGYAPQVDLRRGLQAALDWYRWKGLLPSRRPSRSPASPAVAGMPSLFYQRSAVGNEFQSDGDIESKGRGGRSRQAPPSRVA